MGGRSRTSLSLPYRISVAAILGCGALAALVLYWDGQRAEDERIEAEFTQRATLRHTLTREVLARYTESLHGVSAIFTLDANITRAEFSRATVRLQERLTGSLAFQWIPLVTHENRAAVEAAMRQVYPRRGFEFTEFDANRLGRRAPDQPFYYPICYVEPMRGNEIVLGYNITKAPSGPFLARARELRRFTVTEQFRLLQERGNELGVVMIIPVFRPARNTGDTSSGPPADEFTGFLQCIFHVRELLETASAADDDGISDMLFVDASAAEPAKRVLYFRPAHDAESRDPAPTEAEFIRAAPFIREFSILVGEREWRVIHRPPPGWLAEQRTSTPFVRAGSTLLLTMLLAGLVSVVGRRTAFITRQVEERTAELADSRRQFANFVHTLPGMAYRATYDAEMKIVFASEGTLALTGYTAEEFTSGAVNARDLIHPDDLDRVRRETRNALRSRSDVQVEYRIHTREGREKWVLSRGRGVYDAEERLVNMEGIVIDISDAKRAEEQRLAMERKLLETQKLESLGLLAGGIAHDFNNLLSAILGNASLARMALPPGTAIDPQLRSIETASLRAAELCRQMLAYAGKGRFVVERIDLSAIVEDLLPLLRVSISRSAQLHLELTPNLPGVKADATQVRQIVMNLVLNAVDALTRHEGDITIRTGVTAVDKALLARCATGQGLPAGNYVTLEVQDTGCGMSPEVLAKIFDPFFTTKFAGRGLGLAAVLGIVRSHNGALLVESAVDQGSTFRLYLPVILGEPLPAPENAPETRERWRHSGDVLVIDDEESVRQVIVDLLQTFGFSARAVGDGRAGVAAFQEDASRWNLVIIDLLMPGMSGEETLAQLRAIKADVRVLLVSGYAEGDIMHRVRGPGRIAFLPKPFRPEAFEEKLRELFA